MNDMEKLFIKMHELHTLFYENVLNELTLADFGKALSSLINANICILSSGNSIIYTNNPEVEEKYYHSTIPSDSYILYRIRTDISGIRNILVNEIVQAPFFLMPNGMDSNIFSFFPITATNKNEGVLIVWENGTPLDFEKLILCEATAAMLSFEVGRKNSKTMARAKVLQDAAIVAISVLSFSEQNAIKALLARLVNGEGTVVISEFSKEIYITRSVVSGALKKLETSEVITVRSQGVKGSYIKVNNPYLYSVIEEIDQYTRGRKSMHVSL